MEIKWLRGDRERAVGTTVPGKTLFTSRASSFPLYLLCFPLISFLLRKDYASVRGGKRKREKGNESNGSKIRLGIGICRFGPSTEAVKMRAKVSAVSPLRKA